MRKISLKSENVFMQPHDFLKKWQSLESNNMDFNRYTDDEVRTMNLDIENHRFLSECGLPQFVAPHLWFPKINPILGSAWVVIGIAPDGGLISVNSKEKQEIWVIGPDKKIDFDFVDYDPGKPLRAIGEIKNKKFMNSSIRHLAFTLLELKTFINDIYSSTGGFRDVRLSTKQVEPFLKGLNRIDMKAASDKTSFWIRYANHLSQGQPSHTFRL